MKPRIFKSLKKNKTKKSKRSKGTKKQFGGGKVKHKFDSKSKGKEVVTTSEKSVVKINVLRRLGDTGHNKWFAIITRNWNPTDRNKFERIFLKIKPPIQKVLSRLYGNLKPTDAAFIKQNEVLKNLLQLSEHDKESEHDTEYNDTLLSFITEYEGSHDEVVSREQHPGAAENFDEQPRAGAAENFDEQHGDGAPEAAEAEAAEAESFKTEEYEAFSYLTNKEAADAEIMIQAQNSNAGIDALLHAAKVLVYLHNRRKYRFDPVALRNSLVILNAARQLLQIKHSSTET
jgi:hypothetical protein